MLYFKLCSQEYSYLHCSLKARLLQFLFSQPEVNTTQTSATNTKFTNHRCHQNALQASPHHFYPQITPLAENHREDPPSKFYRLPKTSYDTLMYTASSDPLEARIGPPFDHLSDNLLDLVQRSWISWCSAPGSRVAFYRSLEIAITITFIDEQILIFNVNALWSRAIVLHLMAYITLFL